MVFGLIWMKNAILKSLMTSMTMSNDNSDNSFFVKWPYLFPISNDDIYWQSQMTIPNAWINLLKMTNDEKFTFMKHLQYWWMVFLRWLPKMFCRLCDFYILCSSKFIPIRIQHLQFYFILRKHKIFLHLGIKFLHAAKIWPPDFAA